MKSKLWFLVGVSFKRKVKTKWFVIAQCVILALIVGLLNIDSIIKAFGGDFSEVTSIYVLDDTKKNYEVFKESLLLNEQNMYGEGSHLFDIYEVDDLEKQKEIVNKDGGVIVHIIPSTTDVITAEIISKGTLDTYSSSLIRGSLNSIKVLLAIEELGITPEDYLKIMTEVKVEDTLIDEGHQDGVESTETIMTSVFPIFVLPIFMLTIFLIQMIGAEVNDEKTTKAMEIIISNVSPQTHFFAKVIAGNLFVILQALLLVSYVGLGILVRYLLGGDISFISQLLQLLGSMGKGVLSGNMIIMLPLVIILIILTFVAYALLAGVLASMTTTTEDYQHVQMPIIIISLVGYYLGTMAGLFQGSLFIKICSFIPFISSILAPSLLVLGQIGVIEVLFSIAIMVLTNFVLIKYGLRIYKVGILNYSSSGLWKKMAQALRKESIR